MAQASMIGRRLFQTARSVSLWDDPLPISSELFGIERLEDHARSLAAAQRIASGNAPGPGLARRLAENATFLFEASQMLAPKGGEREELTHAAEWLIDNYHLVEVQIREIGVDLPPGYYVQLPKLAEGPFTGLPRVFGAMWSLVAHTDSHVEPETLRGYLLAYQAVQPLTIGELWAVPITLRIVLIENLRRVSAVIIANRAAREMADGVADRLLGVGGHAPARWSTLSESVPASPLRDAFAVQLAYRLRERDPRSEPALAWLDDRLAERGQHIEAVVHAELQQQGSFNATVRNVITSLRMAAELDWSEVFETICLVDSVLGRLDHYGELDFKTRNLYRTEIEKLARHSPLDEVAVAGYAVAMAAEAAATCPPGDRRCYAGYYLLADGRHAFETAIGVRPSLRARAARNGRRFGLAGYGGAVMIVAAVFLAAPLRVLGKASIDGWWLVLLASIGFVPASDAAVACVNRLAMWAFGANPLPALALSAGIPAPLRTIVAVPALLTSPHTVDELVARLEIHHLASPDGELHFALLSDWVDSVTEHHDGDEALLEAAIRGVDELNTRYGPAPGGTRFILLHRRRVWSSGEAVWMGWERKRGKLHELNRVLRGATDTNFLSHGPLPADVRYVVTLDSDTRLPRDTVRRLVGKMAHPLNAPRIDKVSGRVVEGYAVLQPRVTPSLPTGQDSSVFQRVFSSMDGIDSYAGAVSDVYQDLFSEGSFAGKGIYDIDAFETALAGLVPEGAMLSHDLFEGVFARAGLASDIEVVEDFPVGYAVAAMRQHRWARGDWQLLPWIFPWRAGLGAAVRQVAKLPAIGRWKMMDNLRRTLVAPYGVAALLAGWLLPIGPALGWTGFVLATITLPPMIPVMGHVLSRRRRATLLSDLEGLVDGLRHAVVLTTLIVTFMAHQSVLMSDAVGRTLLRLTSRNRLLQWRTAAEVGAAPRRSMAGHYRNMAGAPMVGLVALGVGLAAQPWVWLLATPFAALWIASPAIAWWSSLKSGPQIHPSAADTETLRRIARRTWRFFETFVTPADNMLPPDNFQEDPAPVVARRTSPTNCGLYLLCTANAHDFGWIGLAEAVDRLEATMASLGRLERFRGHFYNWYATDDLRPLEPRYVSTVDSGNLAGHLIALASACRGWRSRADIRAHIAGLGDTVGVVLEELAHGQAARPGTAAAVQTAMQDLADRISRQQTMAELDPPIRAAAALARELQSAPDSGATADLVYWIEAIDRTAASHRRDLDQPDGALNQRLAALEARARSLALAMEFGFLRNAERKLLSIGYLVADGTLDSNCYDLLASEARLACFVAIAKDDVPAKEWFRLGRAMTPVDGGAVLISWSGSMFEYLMPSLVMRAPAGSLLDQSNRLAVFEQIEFGKSRGIPWGISESAYNVRDLEYTYQYSNFGVPDLGFKRGLDDDAVVAPYATSLAAMVNPHAACRNLVHLATIGALGRYGFYEALDYTPGRAPEGAAMAVVRNFMAHHQGMSIIAIANATLDGIMRTRFHADPLIEATELLLQEPSPRSVRNIYKRPTMHRHAVRSRSVAPPEGRHFADAQANSPSTHLLCNGAYAVMLTAAGSGYSRWQDIAVTRWREDPTLDDWGSYIYLRDVDSGRVWSAGAQPCGIAADAYSVMFAEDHAEFSRRDGALVTGMDVFLSAEEAAEVRRITVSNTGPDTRTVDITSYAELSLCPQAADIAHPAFAKLFVETEYLPEIGALLATRRRRMPTEPQVWAAHMAVADGIPHVETDRARFIGRGRHLGDPAAMDEGHGLSGTVGTVLDPVFAIRRRITLAPGATARIAFWTMVAPSRNAILACVDRHRDVSAFDRAAMMAWTQAQVRLHHLDITPAEAGQFQRLAGHLLFAGPALRPDTARIRRGSGAQSGLWSQGISGDLPILLLRIDDVSDLGLVRHVLLAHKYFRLKQFAVDLVIINEHAASYVQELQGALETLLRAQQEPARPGAGSVYLVRADLVQRATCDLLAAVARVVLAGDRGRLSEQLDSAEHARAEPARMARAPSRPTPSAPAPNPTLELFNGLGGFAEDGREYVVVLGPGQTTPAPWINVIANPGFGFQVSAEGSGFTWAGNSRDNQITPWSNDPVCNRTGEALYLHDEATGALWCPTAAPVRNPEATYLARHGHGYSRFEHTAAGLASSLLQFVAPSDPVKVSRLRLRNMTASARTIAVCAYVDWVLGASRQATAAFIQTRRDEATGALFARNPWNAELGSQVAFMDLGGRQTSWTGDRREFIGRNGSLAAPRGVAGALSGQGGAGLDPCGALRTTVDLAAGGEVELIFVLGAAADTAAARALVTQYRAADLDAVFDAIGHQWRTVLGAIEVETPDRSMDIMLNGWLLYQTLASRIWGRAGFYQASGAYGFRDQLQDGMALCAARPDLVREHVLRAAARQFIEGDVQHWWLPLSGRGVRTRISDDCAWLAYTVAHYVAATGDTDVLDAPAGFLTGDALTEGERDRFFLPDDAHRSGDESATLYEHCARALDHSLALGSHQLPLMGTGDWNDGMNRIGEAGSGESVWLGWFLHAALTAFIPLAEGRSDTARVTAWRAHAAALPVALERCWDGDWYLRAYHDDGSPLGSHTDAQCMIDSIAQSWSVISGVASQGHAARAMASLDRHLVRTDDKLLLVLTPPFDHPAVDPGYIAGYPPGIRENGGQYSHAAMWAVLAFTALGDGDRAGALFAMLNPINHARTPADAERYKVEPYAVVADIYATPPHVGRGGWSWYTGSAGWMQRVGVEGILGIRIQGTSLRIDPCIPRSWPGFTATITWRSARYTIAVENPGRVEQGVRSVTLDGKRLPDGDVVELADDGVRHTVGVTLGRASTEQAA